MKLQNLAVIFIVIVFPISIVISSYTKYQIKTINLQSSYDSKLQNATYDAIKAYQLNATGSGSRDIANSKIRDIEASANTFFNSISSNFNQVGYNQETLKEYVPTLVYTMYDGMYLYSKYINDLGPVSTDEKNNTGGIRLPTNGNIKYKDGDELYGLRPYVYYSQRYVSDDGKNDVVITYSLDNYIVIQGKHEGKPLHLSGNLLTGVTKKNDDLYNYRNVDIEPENNIYQNIFNINEEELGSLPPYCIQSFYCRKIDGIKYYNNRRIGKSKFFFFE